MNAVEIARHLDYYAHADLAPGPFVSYGAWEEFNSQLPQTTETLDILERLAAGRSCDLTPASVAVLSVLRSMARRYTLVCGILIETA